MIKGKKSQKMQDEFTGSESMKIYNSYNVMGHILNLLAGLLSLMFVTYLIVSIEQRTFVISITVFVEALNLGHALILLFFCIFFPRLHGYAISTEGIGTVRATKSGWQIVAYTKWEDIVDIEYVRTIYFGTKVLLIRSSTFTYKRKKVLYINSTQREFKEIVRIVGMNTNINVENLGLAK